MVVLGAALCSCAPHADRVDWSQENVNTSPDKFSVTQGDPTCSSALCRLSAQLVPSPRGEGGLVASEGLGKIALLIRS